MLLQSFETPRKLPSDLGAGVTSGALLLGHGLVAMATGRPGRVLLQPMSGEPGSILEVGIEAIQEIALLSKDVAVVLGGDHVLWALLDLGEGVKVRQVAREIHALSARPHGESALALAIDGKATALTLNRSVVGVRTFAMRGALRACDVGEHVTYAVLGGEGGGQLRIHPGATPELGTSARVALPEAAAGLDRVRGGQLLSAVYKRGEPVVGLVRGPGKLSAKILRLPARPVDVAVLDDHLLVAFVDGRIALYDASAISDAGEAPADPTSAIDLGAEGRPRVILAAQTKSGPMLWVGTSAGEVLSIALREEAEEAGARAPFRIEESISPISAPEASLPPPAPSILPDRADAGEIARLSAELEEARQRIAAGEERIQAQAAERDLLAAEVEALGKGLVTAEAEVRAQAARAASLEADLKDKTAALDAALGDAKQRFSEEETQIAAHAAERGQLSAERDQIEAERDRLSAERDQLEAEVEAIGEKLAAAEAGAARAASLEADLKDRTAALEAAQQRIATAEEQIAAYTVDRGRLGAEVAALGEKVAAAEAEARSRGEQLAAAQAEVEALGKKLAAVHAETESHGEQLAAAQAEVEALGKKLAAAEAGAARAASLEADLKDRTAALEAAQQRIATAEEQTAAHGAERDRLAAEVAAHGAERDRLAAEVAAHGAERDRLAAEVAALGEKLAKAQADLHAKADELAVKTAECDGQESEIEVLENQLGVVDEQLLGFEAELAARTTERDGLVTELDTMQARLTAIDAQITSAWAERDTLRSEIASMRGDLATAQGRLAAAEVEIRSRTAELAAKIVDCDERDSSIEQLQAQLGVVDEHIHGLEAELLLRSSERDTLLNETADLHARLDEALEQRQTLDADLAAHAADRDGLAADLAAARGKIEVAEGQARSREAELTARTGERDALRKEVDRLNAELVRERDRADRASLSVIGPDGISVERAREKFDAVLNQVQNALFKRPRG